jgi:hypothetical protein
MNKKKYDKRALKLATDIELSPFYLNSKDAIIMRID